MKIEKRRFEATDNEVIVEIFRVVKLLVSARIVPHISKVKTELKCSEAVHAAGKAFSPACTLPKLLRAKG